MQQYLVIPAVLVSGGTGRITIRPPPAVMPIKIRLGVDSVARKITGRIRKADLCENILWVRRERIMINYLLLVIVNVPFCRLKILGCLEYGVSEDQDWISCPGVRWNSPRSWTQG